MTSVFPAPFRKPRLGEIITTMKVAGLMPIARNGGGLKRPSYIAWLAALDQAAAKAAKRRRREDAEFFSVRIQLCLFSMRDHHADLDNFVKPILDAMARHEVFGPTRHQGSPMTGDERVDHLELMREQVGGPDQAGVFVEVRSLRGPTGP